MKSLKELVEAEIGAGKLVLPVFNRTAIRLRQLVGSEAATIDEIARVLMEDPSLVARLLMVANSAFYGGLRKIETVNGAIARLGTERVANLALAAGQGLLHRSPVAAIDERMPRLWARSFLSALGCEWLARKLDLDAEPEAAFVGGLLHDVGELYLLKAVEKVVADGFPEAGLTPALIDEYLATLHAEVGHDVMRQWSLPDAFARVARDHHALEADPADALLMLCRLMDWVLQRLGVGAPADSTIELAATLEAQTLGASPILLAELEIYLEDAWQRVGDER